MKLLIFPPLLIHLLLRYGNRSISEGSTIETSELPSNFVYVGCDKEKHKVLLCSTFGQRECQNCLIEFGREIATGDRLIVYTWTLPYKSTSNIDELIAKLSVIEKDAISLGRLNRHKNVVAIKSFKYEKLKKSLKICMVQEFVLGVSLNYFIGQKLPLDEVLLRHVAMDILQSLTFMHDHNIAHRNLRDSSVFMDQLNSTLKVADYGIERKCVEAIGEYLHIDVSASKYGYPQSIGRRSKKCDVFRFGILMISLYKAERIEEVS